MQKEILEKINKLQETIEDDNIKNASKEEVFEYLRLVDELKAMLLTTLENEE